MSGFARRASRVGIDPVAEYGYWERKDGSEGGGLWFDGHVLIDFDGAYELPLAVIQQIRELGFIVPAEFGLEDEQL